MKFNYISALFLASLASSKLIKDFAGEQQSELASPDSYINLGQLQYQKHNDVFGHHHHHHHHHKHHGLYRTVETILPEKQVIQQAERRAFIPINSYGGYLPNIYYLPYGGFNAKYYTPLTGKVASPSYNIAVGTLRNENQAAIKTE